MRVVWGFILLDLNQPFFPPQKKKKKKKKEKEGQDTSGEGGDEGKAEREKRAEQIVRNFTGRETIHAMQIRRAIEEV